MSQGWWNAMAEPLISVIIPVYNLQDVIGSCLDSLLAQDFACFEALVVDDGSTDGSAGICQGYARRDARFHYLHKANGGLSSARNAGLDQARAPYVFFLDGDDTLPPQALSLLQKIKDETQAQLVCGQVYRHYGGPLRLHDGGAVASYAGADVRRHLFDPRVTLTACGKLIDRSLFDRIRFPQGKYFEDAFTVPQLVFEASGLATVDTDVYVYWQRPGSITHAAKSGYYLDWIEAFKQCERLVAAGCPELSGLAHQRLLQSYMRALDMVMCWPGFRSYTEYGVCRQAVKDNLKDILASRDTRPARKLYALGLIVCPDVIAALLQAQRRRQARKYGERHE